MLVVAALTEKAPEQTDMQADKLTHAQLLALDAQHQQRLAAREGADRG